MTPEQLLLRRFKYVEPYPDSQYRLGEIITIVEEQDEWKFQKVQRDPEGIGDNYLWYDAVKFWEYPAIFQELNWWEERNYIFPLYVKKDERVHKIVVLDLAAGGKAYSANEKEWLDIQDCIPSTEEEFSKRFHESQNRFRVT